jgi:hypothetical protein
VIAPNFTPRSGHRHKLDREWVAPPATFNQYAIVGSPVGQPRAISTVQIAREYDLPTLVDFALIHNPETQRTLSAARSAAATAATTDFRPTRTYGAS